VADGCFFCGGAVAEKNRLVLVRGKIQEAHCSDACLEENLRKRRIARATARRRVLLGTLVTVVLAAGSFTMWHRYRAPPKEAIGSWAPDPLPPDAPPPGPPPYGPAWPPTDDDWITAFATSSWVYPLPGPARRAPTVDRRIFGLDPPKNHPPQCRKEGRCGVDLGGELWGEHVYAAHDGVVERVQSAGNDERGGLYVRLSHFGGMVFTQYFHLAAIPRGITRGAHVRAGDIIGLLGDTGLDGARRHLHFALSVRPSSDFAEVYWDPAPWMLEWPLRLPTHGTVAGLTAGLNQDANMPRRRHAR
jgi:hypothetical protein